MFGRRFYEHGRHSRLFEKGDLKYVILDLIKDKPNHGYEIIKALEERFYGFYTPSAGSVYPTLQLLEDMGYVNSLEQDGKKVYTITDEGRKFLKDRGEHIEKIKEHMKNWWDPHTREEVHEVMHEIGHLMKHVMKKVHSMDHAQLSRVREIIARAEKDIDALA